MNNLELYNEYVKAYDELAEKLEKIGASDDMFTDLSALCGLVLNIDPVGLNEEFREKQKALV